MSCAILFPFDGKFQLVREFGRNFSSTPRQIFTLSATKGARNPITTLEIFQLVREPTDHAQDFSAMPTKIKIIRSQDRVDVEGDLV